MNVRFIDILLTYTIYSWQTETWICVSVMMKINIEWFESDKRLHDVHCTLVKYMLTRNINAIHAIQSNSNRCEYNDTCVVKCQIQAPKLAVEAWLLYYSHYFNTHFTPLLWICIGLSSWFQIEIRNITRPQIKYRFASKYPSTAYVCWCQVLVSLTISR